MWQLLFFPSSSCLSPRSAYFYEFPPTDGRETSKKRTTLARLLRGLKTVNRRDRQANQNSGTSTQLRVSTLKNVYFNTFVKSFGLFNSISKASKVYETISFRMQISGQTMLIFLLFTFNINYTAYKHLTKHFSFPMSSCSDNFIIIIIALRRHILHEKHKRTLLFSSTYECIAQKKL